jgi:dimethylamine/trimethylamine dehydrogenase
VQTADTPRDINHLANGRRLSRREIAGPRRESVESFKQARSARFGLLTLYAGLNTFPIYFLYPFRNKRTDEYGGSFENRIRFTREVLEDIRGDQGNQPRGNPPCPQKPELPQNRSPDPA